MGKMMNFGRRTTPLTTDPNTGARILDTNVYGKTFGTGSDKVTVSSHPKEREKYQKIPENQRPVYDGSLGEYYSGKTDFLDDNWEEPIVNINGIPRFTLKRDSARYKNEEAQYGLDTNRERSNLFLQSGLSRQEWKKQPYKVTHSTNPLTMTPLGEGMKWDFLTGKYAGDRYSVTPDQVVDIRYTKKPPKPVEPEKTTANTANVTGVTPDPAPKKPAYTKTEEEFDTIDRLPPLKVGKIATEQGPIKRIVDPKEPKYMGAGIIDDASPKAQKVQQATGYNKEKRSEAIEKSYETGQRMEFSGGAINKRDLKAQKLYNKQYDKFQAEKDKNPMNNKALELFYSKWNR